jgi:uncharacterized protein
MEPIIESPCVRNCCLNDEDICLGCFRSLREITCWGTLDNQGKQHILDAVAQRKNDYLQKLRRK